MNWVVCSSRRSYSNSCLQFPKWNQLVHLNKDQYDKNDRNHLWEKLFLYFDSLAPISSVIYQAVHLYLWYLYSTVVMVTSHCFQSHVGSLTLPYLPLSVPSSALLLLLTLSETCHPYRRIHNSNTWVKTDYSYHKQYMNQLNWALFVYEEVVLLLSADDGRVPVCVCWISGLQMFPASLLRN